MISYLATSVAKNTTLESALDFGGNASESKSPMVRGDQMTPKKLTAVYGGQIFSRTVSKYRNYTHVIIGRKAPYAWTDLTWAGSLQLAQKRVKLYKGYSELKIISVDQGV